MLLFFIYDINLCHQDMSRYARLQMQQHVSKMKRYGNIYQDDLRVRSIFRLCLVLQVL